MSAPNYAAVLRDINLERESEGQKIGRYATHVERAVAVCKPDAAAAVHFAASQIAAIPHQIFDADAVLLLGAVFALMDRGQLNRHHPTQQEALSCIYGAIDELQAEVVREREEQCRA